METIKIPQLETTVDEQSLYSEEPTLYTELPNAETETIRETYALTVPEGGTTVSKYRASRVRKCGGLSEY